MRAMPLSSAAFPALGAPGPLLCGLAMATVGTSVIASKLIGADVEPFLATAVRHALALPVLAALALAMRAPWPRFGWRDALLLLAQAAAGSVGYTVLLIHGTRLARAADAGVVAGTLPVVAALFSMVVLRERPGARMLIAVACASAGVAMLGLAPSDAAGTATWTRAQGIALVLGAVACEVLFILGQKRLAIPVHPVVMSLLMCAGGLLLSALPAIGLAGHAPSRFTWSALAAIAWYAWVPTVLGFVLWYAGAARSSGTQAAVATVWLPITAVVGSAIVLGESIRVWQWVGLLAVLLAVVTAARSGTSP